MASDRTAAPADLTDEGEISHAQQVLVLALATLAEQREADSESHILRVQNYVLTLAQTLAKQEQFAELLTSAYIDTLFLSVPLYDMGSIAIPDRILLKPGRLDADEIAIMRTHTTIGHAAIERDQRRPRLPRDGAGSRNARHVPRRQWPTDQIVQGDRVTVQGEVGEPTPCTGIARVLAFDDRRAHNEQ